MRRRTKGRVTAIGFAISAQAKNASAIAYHRAADRSANRTYAQTVNSEKKVQSTSLRSEAQATDSTCRGWTRKSAATNALRSDFPS